MDQTAERRLFVGREDATARFGALFDAVAQRRGGAIIVTGEPGIGKTRVLQAAKLGASERGLRVATATNYEYVRSPFGPIADALRELLADAIDVLPKAPNDRAALLTLTGMATEESFAAIDNRRLFVVIAETLTRLAQRRPWIITVDDMQWADPESLELLRYLISRIANVPAAIILSLRTPWQDDEGLLSSIARMNDVAELELSPLTHADARVLIAGMFPTRNRLAQQMVDSIATRAEGNPLFLEELTREAFTNSGRVEFHTVRTATEARIRRLDDADRRELEAASVIGRRFNLQTLASISGSTNEAVLRALRVGRDASIVEEIPGEPDAFIFRHELIRAAIYDSILSFERKKLHQSVAQSLRAIPETPNELLALHLLAGGEREEGATVAEAAGDDAASINAFASARDRYLDAEQADVFTGIDAARLNEKLGNAFDLLGDSENAAVRLATCAQYHESVGSTDVATPILLRFANVAHRAGRTAEAIDACNHIDKISRDPEAQFGARAHGAMFLAFADDRLGAAQQIEAAASVHGDHRPKDHIALEYAKLILARFQEGGAAVAAARAAIKYANLTEEPTLIANALLNFGMFACERGDVTIGIEALSQAIETANANGRMYYSAHAGCALIHVLGFSGRLDEAFRAIVAASSLNVDAAVLRVYLADVATPVLADFGKLNYFPNLVDDALIEATLTSGDRRRYATLIGTKLHAAAMSGESFDPQLVAQALAGLDTAENLEPSLFSFARFSDIDQLDRIAVLLESVPDVPGQVRVYRRAADAVVATRTRARGWRAKWIAALQSAERFGAPLIAALALESLDRISEAVAIYKRCDAQGHLARLATAGTGSLTRREAEVAAHVAKGRSNREIAILLSLSERTVEHHVAAALRKHGFTDRNDLRSLFDSSVAGKTP